MTEYQGDKVINAIVIMSSLILASILFIGLHIYYCLERIRTLLDCQLTLAGKKLTDFSSEEHS